MTAKAAMKPGSVWMGAVPQEAPVPLVVTDARLRVSWVNEAFSQAFGHPEAEVRGRSFLQLFPAEEEEHVRHALAFPKGKEVTPFWARLRTRQGQTVLVHVRSRRLAVDMAHRGWVHVLQPAQNGTTNPLTYMSDLFVQGWVQALHARDLETSAHTRRVAQMTVRVARELGISDQMLTVWRWGALLHDIGKVAVPDNILRKPGPLTPGEWFVMRQHPLLAKKILEAAPFLPSEVVEIPLYHHERWDGSGYPFGLAREQIPLAARVFAIVDVWDALRSERPYRLPWPERRVLRYLRLNAGILFDPLLVELFVQIHREIIPG